MPEIFTNELSPTTVLPASVNHQIYCALDSCITEEAFREVSRQFNEPPAIYTFSRGLQGPYLDLMTFGFAIDEQARRAASAALRENIEALQSILNELSHSVCDRDLNPRSPLQLQRLFYETMHLPEVWLSQKGQRKLSTNREALEKLETYLYARPFISCILAIRDLAKQLETFETEIDSDGRFRTSYNIAGTETGRPSSSSNAFGTGGNIQNIAPALRYVFVADPGHKLGQVDLEQVEARDVGWFCGCLFNDWMFLDACESGDLHTNNARRIWPELPWTDDPRANRALADRNFYRDFSYRDMAKRGSHLSNYMGTAWTASRALKVPLPMMEEFQARYCRGRVAGHHGPTIVPAYPCIPRFWQWIAEQLQTKHLLVTPFGRRRHFFGRAGDDATLREAIAFLPQSTTGDRNSLVMWRIWKHIREAQILGNGFDSVVFQYEDRGPEHEGRIVSQVLEQLDIPFIHPASGRRYCVPGEVKVGWNWGNLVTRADQDRARREGTRIPQLNLDGLRKWSASRPDDRKRTRPLERMSGQGGGR